MRPFMFSPVLLLLAATLGVAQEPEAPHGNPPQFALASAVKQGDEVKVSVRVLQYVTKQKVVDGKTIQYTVSVWTTPRDVLLGKQIFAFQLDGKPAPSDAVLKALAKPTGTAVFVVYGLPDVKADKAPDPFYLSALREGSVALSIRNTDLFPPAQSGSAAPAVILPASPPAKPKGEAKP